MDTTNFLLEAGIVSVFQGRLHKVEIGCRNLAKGAMRHFWKIANRGFVGKFFVKDLGKISGEIVWGKIWWGWFYQSGNFHEWNFAEGKTERYGAELGSVGNPGFGNLNIAMGCDRMVKRSRGHMGHIEGHFRDLFFCTILTNDFSENGVYVPHVPPGKNNDVFPLFVRDVDRAKGEHMAITFWHTFRLWIPTKRWLDDCGKGGIEVLGIWEQLNNPDFNPIGFDGIRKQGGYNSFTLTPKQWIEKTQARGSSQSRVALGRVAGSV